MNRGLDDVLGVLGADHHVAELTRAGGGPGPVHRKGEDVGGRVAAAVLAVERANLILAHERDGNVALIDPNRFNGGKCGSTNVRIVGPVDL